MKKIIFILTYLISRTCYAACEIDELQLKVNTERLEEIIESAILHAKEKHSVDTTSTSVKSCQLSGDYLRLRLSPHKKKDNTEYFAILYCSRSKNEINCNSYLGRILEYDELKVDLGSYVSENHATKILGCIENLKNQGKLYQFKWDYDMNKYQGEVVKRSENPLRIGGGEGIHSYIVSYANSSFEVKFSLDSECSVTWVPPIVV